MANEIPVPIDRLGSQDNEAGYIPTDEERKAIKMADYLYAKARKARAPYDEKWVDNYRMFRGRQWKDGRPTYRHSEVINLIFRAIQAEVPIITDTRPKIEFVPVEPNDRELAQILNDILDSDWNDGNWLFKLTEMIYDSKIYGTAFGSLEYDPECSYGKGRIKFKCEDPFAFYPDPSARDVNEECNYIVFAEPVAVEVLKRDYPNKAKFIKSDLLDLSKYERINWSEQIHFRKAGDSRTFTEGSSNSYNLESKDEALKITLYIHDEEYIEEEIKETNPETGEVSISYMQKLKYPKGRKIVICSGVLLEDGEIEFDDDKFPYFRLVNYMLPHEFWGISEIEQLESPQRTFNKLVSFAMDVLTLMGNPIWVVDNNSDVDTDNLFNRPGLIVEKSPGSEVRREAGVQLQPYVLQMIDNFKNWFDDVSGSTDASRGIRPQGVTAASAIESLNETSQTRIRQKMRNLDACLQSFGKLYVSRVLQYYTSPRIFRVTGNNNATKYFKFHVDEEDVVDPLTGMPTGEKQKVAKFRSFETGLDGQEYESNEKAMQISGEFDVRITSGSGLPFEKARRESQSYQLFDRGIIDAEEVLKNIQYPNYEAVVKKMQDKAAQQAEAEMAGQMGPQQ